MRLTALTDKNSLKLNKEFDSADLTRNKRGKAYYRFRLQCPLNSNNPSKPCQLETPVSSLRTSQEITGTFPSIDRPNHPRSDSSAQSITQITLIIGKIIISDTLNILVTSCMIDNLILAVGMFFLYPLICGYYWSKIPSPL